MNSLRLIHSPHLKKSVNGKVATVFGRPFIKRFGLSDRCPVCPVL